MPTFTDIEGEEWNIRLNYYDIREIQEETDVDFLMEEDTDQNPGREIARDADKFMTAVWISVRDQANGRGLSKKEVKQRLAYGPFVPLVRAWTQAVNDFLGVSAEEIEEMTQETGERPTEGEED